MLTNDIPALLESAYGVRDEIVVCLLGKPGIGKTQYIYQFAEAKGAKVVEIIASQILPNEVSGITMPVDSTHSMEIYDHARLSSLKDGDILFFDELLQASPQTLSACLTLIQERRMMSGKKLPDIMIVAAANELNSASMIPMQIRQRFLFVPITWNEVAWCKHNNEKYGINAEPVKAKRIVSFTDTDYNVLTPRTVSKLIAWYAKAKDSDDKAWTSFVSATFGIDVVNTIKEMFYKSPKTQLLDAIEEVMSIAGSYEDVIKFGKMKQDWHNISIREIYCLLQGLECWPEIEKALRETKIEEV